jgi:N-acetyl-anhydromuramyl-L-alanine amidase AmpD
VQLITAGFSRTDGAGFVSDYGVRRTYQAVVWHSMEGFLAGALASWNSGKAGAHLAILKDGTVVLTCPLVQVAWHAGTDDDPQSGTYGRTPFWRRPANNINPHSIGIELEGFADARDGGFTLAQQRSIRRVADWLTGTYGILRQHTLDQIPGHHRHSELSAMRGDPGPTFQFAWAGVAE